MPLSLTWQQLAATIALTCFFSVLTFSRRRIFPLQPLLILGASFLVLATIWWNYSMMSTAWYGREDIFEHPGFGVLPSLVVIGCPVTSVLLLASSVASIALFRDYSLRQRVSYVCAAVGITIGLVLLGGAPSRIQALVDSF